MKGRKEGNGRELSSSRASHAIKGGIFTTCLWTTVKQSTLGQKPLSHSQINEQEMSRRPKDSRGESDSQNSRMKEKRQLFLTSQGQNVLQRTASPIVLEWYTREINMFYFDCLSACKTQRHHADGSTHANRSDDTAPYSLSPHWRTHAASKRSRNSALVQLQINVLPPCSPYGA